MIHVQSKKSSDDEAFGNIVIRKQPHRTGAHFGRLLDAGLAASLLLLGSFSSFHLTMLQKIKRACLSTYSQPFDWLRLETPPAKPYRRYRVPELPNSSIPLVTT